MMYAPSEIILYFFIYAVLGWVWETFYCWAKEGHFVYRGLLKGPYCPIYAFGILLVFYIVIPLEESPLELFIFSMVVATVLEYVTGCLLEHVFRMRLWNYDNMPMNIHGRVAVPVSVFWGFSCLAAVEYIHPQVEILVSRLHHPFGIWLPLLIVLILTADTLVSLFKLHSFREILHSKFDEHAVCDEQTAKNSPEVNLPGIRPFDKRILRAFPRVDIRGIRGLKDSKKRFVKKKIDKNRRVPAQENGTPDEQLHASKRQNPKGTNDGFH